MYLLISLLFAFLLLSWWLWRWYQVQKFLARQPTTKSPDIRELFIKGIDDNIFQSVSLARTAQGLRQHISSKSPNSLDIAATIEQTIQAGGWFTPVSGTIKNRPEYLVLIDRTTFNDHHSELINHSIIKQLKDQDVIIKSYYFDEVPLRFYSEKTQSPPLTLTELAQAYPEHRLMVFSDGNGLINPITLKTVNWIEQFSVWSQRALFTLETPDQWGYREHILEEANFLILPANEDGLKTFIERINSGSRQAYPKPPYSFYNQFPEYIQERPRRWLEQHKPDTPVLTELLTQIKDFLGKDAYQWFSACAVYPELRWQLTLYLAYQLKLFNEDSLAKLAHLPWFRYGYMPDWLREQLIKDLFLPQERKIRKALYDLFLQGSEKPLSDFSFEIAEKQKDTLYALSKRIWSKWVKKTPKNRSLKEHIFLTFMNDPLAVKVHKNTLKISYLLVNNSKTSFSFLEKYLTKLTINITKISKKIFTNFKKISTIIFKKVIKISQTSFTFLIMTFFKKVKDELPGLLPLLWLILIKPNTLRDRLKSCGIENPDASILKLWFSEVKTRLIQRQYVKQFLLLLFVVIPIISLSIAYLVFGVMLGFSIGFSYWTVVLLASIIAGLLGGMFVSVPLGAVLGLLIAMIAATGVEIAESVTMIAVAGVDIAESMIMIAAAGVSIAESMIMIAVSTGVSIAESVKIRMVIGFVIGVVGSFALARLLDAVKIYYSNNMLIYNLFLILSIIVSLVSNIILGVICGVLSYFTLLIVLLLRKNVIFLVIAFGIIPAGVGGMAGSMSGDPAGGVILFGLMGLMIGIFIANLLIILTEYIEENLLVVLVVLGVIGCVLIVIAGYIAFGVTIILIILLLIEKYDLTVVLKVIGGISGCVAAGLIGIITGAMAEGIAVGLGLNVTILFLLGYNNDFKNNLLGFFIAIVISISTILIYNKYYYNGLMEKPESAKKVVDACIFSPGQYCVG